MEVNGSEISQNGGDRSGPKVGHQDISSIIGNMVLAHELIVNDEYQLTSYKDNTLEKAVRDVVHKAFWDQLQEQLDQDPPLYDNALQLLKEIKETMLSLMAPQNEMLKSQINEVLDMDLIAQEVSHNCFDLNECARFIIIILSKLCAPIRDEEVKALGRIEGILPTIRGILELLDEMKMDMANFQLQQLKPYLMKHCVEYEQNKFKEFLDRNPAGALRTKDWLKTAVTDVSALIASSSRHNEAGQSPNASPKQSKRSSPGISNTVILTHAYLLLLDVNDGWVAPETLLMDELRLAEMSYMFNRLALIGSVMLIVSNVVGQHLASDASYVKKLKDDLFVLLDGVSNNKLAKLLPNIFEQVLSETKKTIESRDLPSLTPENCDVLKGQIAGILDGGNSVHRLVKSRVRDYVLLCMTSEKTPRHNEAPLALANVQEELKNLAGRFARLITHSRNIFQPFYNEIINSIFTEQQQGEDSAANGDSRDSTDVSQ